MLVRKIERKKKCTNSPRMLFGKKLCIEISREGSLGVQGEPLGLVLLTTALLDVLPLGHYQQQPPRSLARLSVVDCR